MEAILTLLVMVMIFIVARKWVHETDATDDQEREENPGNHPQLPDGVRGR